jgi:hypothetical protein
MRIMQIAHSVGGWMWRIPKIPLAADGKISGAARNGRWNKRWTFLE